MSQVIEFRTAYRSARTRRRRLLWTATYIGSIVVSNLLLQWLPMVEVLGVMIPPAIATFGFVFVFRDFAQREIGHGVLVAMIVAAALTYFLAGPAIAVASLVAFSIGELVDWCVYSLLKRPFSQRVAISSIAGVLVDTFVFFHALGILEPHSFVVGSFIKLVGTAVFWSYLAARERREEARP
jgi:queuosine precursor transporter